MRPAHQNTFSFDLSCQPQMNTLFFFESGRLSECDFSIIFIMFCFFWGYPRKWPQFLLDMHPLWKFSGQHQSLRQKTTGMNPSNPMGHGQRDTSQSPPFFLVKSVWITVENHVKNPRKIPGKVLMNYHETNIQQTTRRSIPGKMLKYLLGVSSQGS